MNFLLKRSGIVAAIALMALIAPATKSAAQTYSDDYVNYNDGYSASYQDFYDGLSPYGQWIQDPQYGYVWLPNVGQDFRPYYSNGHWVMTQYGNTWVSDYPWGWAPFHYGRWTYDSFYGWLWIPGTQWGPAWVNWRSSNDYYGWAPLGPGISISMSFGWACPNDWWVFIPNRYIYNPRFQGYYRGPRYNTTIINNTTIIHNTYINNSSHSTYITGPRANEIQQVTNQRVNVYNINNGARPGASTIQNNTVNIYRPQIQKGSSTAPREIVKPQQNVGRPQEISVNNGRPEGREAILNQRPVQNVRPQQQLPTNTRVPATQAPQQNQNDNFNRQPQNIRPQQQVQPAVQQPVPQSRPERNNYQPQQQQSRPMQQIPQQQAPQPRPQPVQQQQPPRMEQPRQQQMPPQQPRQQPMQQPRPQPMPQQHVEQARPAPTARPSR